MKKIILLLILPALLHAQKLEFGKVSISELEEKSYAADTTAPAAIIYKKGKTIFKYRNDRFYIDHEFEFRIKIYKKEGLSWGTFAVPYFTGYKELNDDFIVFSNAVTYNLENGKVTKTKAGGESRFKSKINDKWSEASIMLPNVKVGSVIEFKYSMRTEEISDFPIFHFQYSIPLKWCSYTTEIPVFFQYKPVICGFASIVQNANIVDGGMTFDNKYGQSVQVNYNALSRNYFVENMPALKNEPFVDNIQNYRSAVKHELEKVQFEGEKPKLYSTTWEAVALEIYKDERFGNELRQRDYFETSLDYRIKSVSTPLERANEVFNFVKQSMSWNNEYGYLTSKGVKKAFADKTGNAAEINLMLVAMLNYVGISAQPVLISTIRNGVAAFPNQLNFDFVIASATIDGNEYLYDATNKNTAPNILPFRDLNWHGWRIDSSGNAVQEELVPSKLSKEIGMIQAQIDASGLLLGKIRKTLTDYLGLDFREKYKNVNQEEYLQKLESELGNIEISNYSVQVPEDCALQVEERFGFKSSVDVIGENMYFNPLLFLAQTKNPFVSDMRNLPIYFGFPMSRKYTISVDIPQGYTIVSTPKPISLALPEKMGSFTCRVQGLPQKIQISFTSEVNKAVIASGFYEQLKQFYQSLIDIQNEKIVLKKI